MDLFINSRREEYTTRDVTGEIEFSGRVFEYPLGTKTLEKLGFTPLAQIEHGYHNRPDSLRVVEVMVDDDLLGYAFFQDFKGRPLLRIRTLFADGSFLETTSQPPSIMARALLSFLHAPLQGLHWVRSPSADPKRVWESHCNQIKKISRRRKTRPAKDDTISTFIVLCDHIGRLIVHRVESWMGTFFFLAVLLCSLTVWFDPLPSWPDLFSVLLAGLAAIIISPLASRFVPWYPSFPKIP